jgi:hypothetical protein
MSRLSSLPSYVNTDLPAARRLTHVLNAMDPQLRAGWNKIVQRFEVWGPSRSAGWALILRVERPDGSYLDPEVYPHVLLDQLHSRQQPLDDLEARHAKEMERRWLALMDAAGERAKYVAKAVAQEASGTLRYGLADVFAGLAAAEGAA